MKSSICSNYTTKICPPSPSTSKDKGRLCSLEKKQLPSCKIHSHSHTTTKEQFCSQVRGKVSPGSYLLVLYSKPPTSLLACKRSRIPAELPLSFFTLELRPGFASVSMWSKSSSDESSLCKNKERAKKGGNPLSWSPRTAQ